MQPIAVDARILRAAAPDLALTVGRSLGARVLERAPSGLAMLNLAGAIVTAELPAHVGVGERLRLVVRETTTERVLLQIAAEAQQPVSPGQVPPAPAEAPLDRGRLAVLSREGGAGGGAEGEEGAVTLRWETPALGVAEVRVALEAGLVRARVALAPGAPLELAAERVDGLRAALARAASRPVEVTLVPRRDPVDLYA